MSKPRLLLGILVASFFVAALFEPIHPESGEIFSLAGLVHTLIIGFLLYAWCKADAAQRHVAPPLGAALLCAFIPPVGLPYYLFRSRPWPGALLGIAALVTLAVLAVTFFYAGLCVRAH